ncbi:hypothetical protein ACJRO7_015738 [Eucalyptus globulus]|uniref:BRISC and BRCA1-A complex member 1 n=1 Tax=Eucalyptus globulus TaxID=34317 RepID=A0ABD3L4Q1_EUCGL
MSLRRLRNRAIAILSRAASESETRVMMMEGVEGDAAAAAAPRYVLNPARISSEDILFCVDVDAESLVEMKATGPGGRPFARLDAIKQSLLLFVHSKLAINPDHRFAFATLSKSASWLHKEFSSDVESAAAAIRSLSATSACDSHILHQWPVNQKLFTLDVIYLHDKPGPDNCPQQVYDALVDVLEHVSEYEGHIHESGQGLTRILFRHMCMLRSHPQQRCPQDYLDIPKSLVKKSPAADSAPAEESAIVPRQ